ncbi:hypothetical protein [Lacinutrix jangbogonensis]|uniref:hypothetical protein n=1 Tax=Lacinutrix jangbogonensis TaxID=1469557 RepID=UPI00053D41AF|nr:hypothetical protein [Lacinutrix jangbogonensis]
MKTKILITTTLILLLLFGCSKDDENNAFIPSLPEATQTGKNTFGCYIDGVLLTPRNGEGANGFPDTGMSFSALGDAPDYIYNEINIRDFKSGTGGQMDIHIIDLHANGEGSFIINESNCEDNVDANNNINIRCRLLDKQTNTYNWYCSIENGGTLTITRYDFDNGIISGTFNCTVQNYDNPEDSIEITQGRFDINRTSVNLTSYP